MIARPAGGSRGAAPHGRVGVDNAEMSSPISVLLFDLGGVLVDFSGPADLNTLLPTPMDEAALIARWAACPSSLAYGAGTIDTDTFLTAFKQAWQIPLPPPALLAAWQSWVRGWLPGAEALLDDLRPRYRLAALSNSNAAHWERLTDLGVVGAFDPAIGSQQTGVRKPDPAIYRLALDRIGVSAPQVLFFDDSLANVEAARALGFSAVQVDGPAAVRRHLLEAGLL